MVSKEYKINLISSQTSFAKWRIFTAWSVEQNALMAISTPRLFRKDLQWELEQVNRIHCEGALHAAPSCEILLHRISCMDIERFRWQATLRRRMVSKEYKINLISSQTSFAKWRIFTAWSVEQNALMAISTPRLFRKDLQWELEQVNRIHCEGALHDAPSCEILLHRISCME
jgi:hypothetical protein